MRVAVIIFLLLVICICISVALYQPVKRAIRFRREELTMRLEAINAARAMLREAMRSWWND